jgi:subtilisin-like proprotein convertase family protein
MAVGCKSACWTPIASDQGTVTEVNVKYILDHPDPGQLEVRLSRENGEVNQTLRDSGNLEKDTELGQVIGLEAFNGSPAQGGWIFMVRDVVPGQAGWLRGLTVRPFYTPTGPMPVQLSGTPG